MKALAIQNDPKNVIYRLPLIEPEELSGESGDGWNVELFFPGENLPDFL